MNSKLGHPQQVGFLFHLHPRDLL